MLNGRVLSNGQQIINSGKGELSTQLHSLAWLCLNYLSYTHVPKIHHSVLVFRCRPLCRNALEVNELAVVVSDGGLHLVASSGEGAVESLLTLVLWSEATQQHVVLTRSVGNHQKSTEGQLGAVHTYYNCTRIRKARILTS